MGNFYHEREPVMDKQTPLVAPGQLPRHSFWHRLRTTLILRGILAPPGTREIDLTEKEQEVRRRAFFLFRRHPGGR